MTTDAVGGVWTYSVDLAAEFAQRGLEVVLAVLGPAPSAAQIDAARRIPGCQLWHHGSRLEWMDEPWVDVDATSAWLWELGEKVQPDIVHLNDFTSARLPWKAPVILAAHSCVATWWRSVKGEKSPERYAEYRRRVRGALEAADRVITPTSAFRHQLMREYGLRLEGCTIPNARQAKAFLPDLQKQELIVSAGRLWDEGKNLKLLDQIAHRLEWNVAVAGETKAPSAAAFAGRSIECVGQLESPELASLLGKAGIFASPALYEPFGLAVLEAALSGCALVLSDLPTFRELWDGCARFVPADDENAWVRALNELSVNHAERQWLQSRARARALGFSPARQAQAYLSVYNAVLREHEAMVVAFP